MGGEDTVNEVVHGLLERTQVDSDLVDIDPDTKLTKCDIPLGIVPVGDYLNFDKFLNSCIQLYFLQKCVL